MKIRTQNLLTIVPFFLVLAASSSALLYFTKCLEYQESLNAEAKALAVTIAEFVDPASLSDPSGRLLISLERVLRWGQARRIFFLSPNSVEPQLDLGQGRGGDATPPRPCNSSDEVQLGEIHLAADSTPVLTAWAPLVEGAGCVGVEIDARAFEQWEGELRSDAYWLMAIVLVAGVALALGLSQLLAGKFRQLNEAISRIAAGHYDYQVDSSTIEEVRDLGNTLETMGTIAVDALIRSRNILKEGEQFRSEADLAATYKDRLWQPFDLQLGPVSVVARLFGRELGGEFLDVFSTETGHFALSGQVAADGTMTSVVTASAVLALIRRELTIHGPDKTLQRIGELFDILALDLLFWDQSPRLSRWSIRQGESGARQTDIELRDDVVLAVYHFDERATETVEALHATFPRLAPHALMQDLEHLIGPKAQGSLILIVRI